MARSDLETLVFSLEAKTSTFSKQVDKMNAQFAKQMGQTEKRAKAMQSRLDSTFSKIGTGIQMQGLGMLKTTIAGLVAGATIGKIREAVSAVADLADKAQEFGLSTDMLQTLYVLGERAGATFEQVNGALARFTGNTAEAADVVQKYSARAAEMLRNADSQEDRIRALAYAFNFLNTAEQKAALGQDLFGKSGSRMAQAFSEAKGSIDTVTQNLKDLGQIHLAETITKADALDKRMVAIGQSIERTVNKAIVDTIDLIGKLVNSSGAINTATAQGAMQATSQELTALQTRLKEAEARSDKAMASDIQGRIAVLQAQRDALRELASAQALTGLGAPAAPTGPRSVRGGTPFKPTSSIPASSTGAAGGGSAASQVDQTKAVIEALRFEGEQLARTAQQQELYNRLKEAGVARTSAQGQVIEQQVRANQALEASQAKLKASQESLNESMKAFADIGTTAIDSLIVGGESLNDVMSNVLKNIASLLIQAALSGGGPLAGLMGTAGVGGAPGGLFGALLSGVTARAGGGPVRKGEPYLVGERGREMFVPAMAGRIIPNDRLKAVAGGGQAINVQVTNNLSAPGADPAQLMRLQQAFAASEADMPRKIKASVGAMQSRRVR